MKLRSLAIVFAGLVAAFGIAGDPALARAVHKAKHQRHASCAPAPAHWSWRQFWLAGPPQPNGCAPPVFADGRYIGQDPDINIRTQLYRQPNTGYTIYQN